MSSVRPPAHIVGHHDQVQSLLEDLERGNVAHAYLLTGTRHLGKFTVAKWFAKTLLQHGALTSEEEQQVSATFDRLIHSDLFVLDQLWIEGVCEDFALIARTSNVPQHHRKETRAKTDEISIDDIRALQERLYEVGTGRHRCCLIRSAERMTEPAANALLKVLEEPPEGMVFLLTSQYPSAVLATVISRTRILRFSRLPYQELQPLLENVNADDAQFLLRLAQGAPGVVCRLRDDPDALRCERTMYANAADFWRSSSLSSRLPLLTPLTERSEEAEHLLLHLALALRERAADGVHPPGLRPVPAQHWSGGQDYDRQATRALHELMRGLKTNTNRKLLVHEFALRVTV